MIFIVRMLTSLVPRISHGRTRDVVCLGEPDGSDSVELEEMAALSPLRSGLFRRRR